jgi:hypothetical protein
MVPSKPGRQHRPVQLSFQWLARPAARSLLPLFTFSSRRRLSINQLFFDPFNERDCGGDGQRSFDIVV